MGLLQSKWSLVLAGLGVQDGELGELPQWVERGALDLIWKLTLRNGSPSLLNLTYWFRQMKSPSVSPMRWEYQRRLAPALQEEIGLAGSCGVASGGHPSPSAPDHSTG
jgi:hypothetical protein